MAKSGPKPKYTDQEVIDSLLEGARLGRTNSYICTKLDVDPDYILDRSKKSVVILRAIKKARALREEYYTQMGQALASGKLKGGNVVAYIWLTRNILGWRDDPKELEEVVEKAINKTYKAHWGGTREPGSDGES